jgi:hypothetical protein
LCRSKALQGFIILTSMSPVGHRYLTVDNATGLIEFIKDAFDGSETLIRKRDDEKIIT